MCRLELMLCLMSLFKKLQITHFPINLHLALAHAECSKNQSSCCWGNSVSKFAIYLHAKGQGIQKTRNESSSSTFITLTTISERLVGNKGQEKNYQLVTLFVTFEQIIHVWISSWPSDYLVTSVRWPVLKKKRLSYKYPTALWSHF